MFAGLAEVSGTGILPFLDKDVQHIYVWFLIALPTLLILLFFGTLNFNHRVLYAPSDYRNDESFFRALTPAEQREKIEREVDEFVATLAPSSPQIAGDRPLVLSQARDEYVQAYSEAEQLVARELQLEYGSKVKTNVALYSAKTVAEFDAVVELRRSLIGVEVKLFTRTSFSLALLDHLAKLAVHIDRAAQQNFGLWGGSLMLVAVTTFPERERQAFESRLAEMIAKRKIPVELRVYDMQTLKSKHAVT